MQTPGGADVSKKFERIGVGDLPTPMRWHGRHSSRLEWATFPLQCAGMAATPADWSGRLAHSNALAWPPLQPIGMDCWPTPMRWQGPPRPEGPPKRFLSTRKEEEKMGAGEGAQDQDL